MFVLMQFYQLMEFKEIRPLLYICDCEIGISPLNFMMIMDMPEDSPFFSSEGFRFVDTICHNVLWYLTLWYIMVYRTVV